MFEYKLAAQDSKSKARTGEFKTPHGTLQTPSLAIVGTEGQIKGIPADVTPTLPLNYTIVNTFHIWTKNIIEKIHDRPRHPGLDPESIQIADDEISSNGNSMDSPQSGTIARFRGNDDIPTVHSYGGFPGVVASDSGGFQVFSLGFGKTHKVGKLMKNSIDSGSEIPVETGNRSGMTKSSIQRDDTSNPLKITEEGVTFKWNDEDRTLTPELSMELQHKIGADIMFAFDECTSPFNSKEYVSKSVELTDRWLARCVNQHNRLACHPERSEGSRKLLTMKSKTQVLDSSLIAQNDRQLQSTKNPLALFAIVQGSEWQDLRIKSAKLCAKHDVPGFGIGGSFGNSFGDSKRNMHQVLEWIMPHLPNEKPRHLLGIGQVDDIFEGVERGVDLFDCVIPTREARHKMLYTKRGRIAVKKIKTQNEPIALECKCIACDQKITGRQLYELFLHKDPRAFFYATVHNIQFFADLMKEIREAIPANRFGELKTEYLRYY